VKSGIVKTVKLGLAFDLRILKQVKYERALRNLDVVVFPELADGGYAALERGSAVHRKGDALWETFREASRRFSCTCVAGSMLVREGMDAGTNASYVFSRGRVIHRYDKIHLFRPTGDHKHFVRGEKIRAFGLTVRGKRMRGAVILCYDLRFPELTRALALQKIQMLFVPARWPGKRDAAWQTLLRARAIENQIFVVGCNARGSEGGQSYVFGPSGEELYSSRGKRSSPLTWLSLDPGQISNARRLHRNIREAVLLNRMILPGTLPRHSSRPATGR
jgi:predicted amidohydrolase